MIDPFLCVSITIRQRQFLWMWFHEIISLSTTFHFNGRFKYSALYRVGLFVFFCFLCFLLAYSLTLSSSSSEICSPPFLLPLSQKILSTACSLETLVKIKQELVRGLFLKILWSDFMLHIYFSPSQFYRLSKNCSLEGGWEEGQNPDLN